MKKYTLCLGFFMLLFFSCQKRQLADIEYWNQTAFDKINDYWNGFTTGTHDVFNIGFQPFDTTPQTKLTLTSHISYGHTLESFKLHQEDWVDMPIHFGSNAYNSTLSNNVDQLVQFQIRSKSPQGETMSGEVLIPKATPIKAQALGNNRFKITWTPLDENKRVLLYLYYFRVYVIRLNSAFAVETDDDGEYIFDASIFEKLKVDPTTSFVTTEQKETVTVNLLRGIPKRKTIVKQPSTGVEYSVYGGGADATSIEVEIK
jgi:hypothetical protein